MPNEAQEQQAIVLFIESFCIMHGVALAIRSDHAEDLPDFILSYTQRVISHHFYGETSENSPVSVLLTGTVKKNDAKLPDVCIRAYPNGLAKWLRYRLSAPYWDGL